MENVKFCKTLNITTTIAVPIVNAIVIDDNCDEYENGVVL